MATEVRIEKAPKKRSKRLHHLEIHPADRGRTKFAGALVEAHHAGDTPFGGEAPARKSFGPGDGGALLAHIGGQLGIPAAGEEAAEPQHDEEEA